MSVIFTVSISIMGGSMFSWFLSKTGIEFVRVRDRRVLAGWGRRAPFFEVQGTSWIDSYVYRILDEYLPLPQSQYRLPTRPTSASLNIHCLLKKLIFIRNFFKFLTYCRPLPSQPNICNCCISLQRNRLEQSSTRLGGIVVQIAEYSIEMRE